MIFTILVGFMTIISANLVLNPNFRKNVHTVPKVIYDGQTKNCESIGSFSLQTVIYKERMAFSGQVQFQVGSGKRLNNFHNISTIY